MRLWLLFGASCPLLVAFFGGHFVATQPLTPPILDVFRRVFYKIVDYITVVFCLIDESAANQRSAQFSVACAVTRSQLDVALVADTRVGGFIGDMPKQLKMTNSRGLFDAEFIDQSAKLRVS